VRKIFLILIAGIVLLFAFAACGNGNGGNDNDLIGTWRGNNLMVYDATFPLVEYSLYFLEDGTGYERAVNLFSSFDFGVPLPFTWKAEGGQLWITLDENTNLYRYEINGSSLSLHLVPGVGPQSRPQILERVN